ncbi:MAG: hypothetical protein LBL81_05995, partial [Tannerella sp.]|nr:hypothetical protein [Tannerella sp.]
MAKIERLPNLIMLGAVALLFWLMGYGGSIGFPLHSGATDPLLWQWLAARIPSKTVAYALGIFFVLAGAFCLQRMNYVLIIIREKTYLPLFFYILLSSCDLRFQSFHPSSVATF